MQDYKREEYKVFELFDKKWALVTLGIYSIITVVR